MRKIFLGMALISLASCAAPVYVNKTVLVPKAVPCKVHLPKEIKLPTQGVRPKGWQKELSLALQDVKILKKELEVTREAARGCN